MGVIVIYIYALIAFAFFRPLFNPDDELYCATLAECTVSLLRYGGAAQLTDVRFQFPRFWLFFLSDRNIWNPNKTQHFK